MRPIIVDSSVLMAFCDPDDPAHKVARASVEEAIANGHPMIVPATALSEVLVGAYRSTPHAVRTILGFVDELAAGVHSIDQRTAQAAARYRAEHAELGFPAALVLATAKERVAACVLTTESSWRDVDPRVVVVP
jgi:predicted nucleic acid-binding protein